jgi:Exopolysaccharide synthesis, ExoD
VTKPWRETVAVGGEPGARVAGDPDDRQPRHGILYAVNPLPRQGLATLFMTHPPIAERIRRLRALDGDRAFALAAQSAMPSERQPRPVSPAVAADVEHPPDLGEPLKLSDQLERWLTNDSEKTLGSLVDAFGDKSFAILLVLPLGVPVLPLPTGGVTHLFEVIAVLLALELIVGRHEVWLPRRWRALELAGEKQQRFVAALLKLIRRLERFSRPRLRLLFPVLSSPDRLAAWGRCPRSALSCSRSACSSRTSPSPWPGSWWASPELRSRSLSVPQPSTAC